MSQLRVRGSPVAFLLGLLLAACGTARPVSAPAAAGVQADSGWAEVEGGRLYYEVAGRGPALVLLHGGFGDRRMWEQQFGELARDFRVVRYDHRGFGRSPAPESDYSPVADLLRLLDHLGMERAHLVGNSMGGSLALEFALLHPERTGRLVVVASGANGYPFTDADAAPVMEVFRAAQEQGAERAAELWLQNPMVAVASRDPATAPLLRAMVSENRGIFQMQHWPREPLDPPAFERVRELRLPVLFILGERDAPLVGRVAEETARRIPGARSEVLPGADHLPQMARPAEFNRLVREFLLAR